jgi:hypothetical protein
MSFNSSKALRGGASALLLSLFLLGCTPESVKAPASFSDFTSPDKTFAGKGPDGWKKDEAGVQGGMQSSVTFEQGTAQMSVTANFQESLMSDISKANNAQIDNAMGALPNSMQSQLPRSVPPVEKLHVMNKSKLEGRYTNYDEKPMQILNSSLGEGRISEFTGERADGFMHYKVHGYRATMLSGERGITAVCRCTEEDWKALSPGFAKFLQSLALGPG